MSTTEPPDDGAWSPDPPPPPPPVYPPASYPPPPAPPSTPIGVPTHPAPPPPSVYAPGPPTTNGFAIASLVLGIVGCACLAFWILALVFGYMARSQIDQAHGRQSGRGMATAGIVLGWVWAGLTLVYLVVVATT